MGILLGVTLPLIILGFVAYRFIAPGPESEFFKNFSLEEVLKKLLPREIKCLADPFPAVYKDFSTDPTSCKPWMAYIPCNQDGGKRFNDDGVLKSLEFEIEKELEANGAILISKDTSIPNRINIVYESGKVRGLIKASGEWESDFYLMRADLVERRKRWRFANKSEVIT
jgi:hypothetical protein